MVTLAEEKEPEPGRVHVALDTSERIVREVVAGNADGAIRRILLYIIVGMALVGLPLPLSVPTALLAIFGVAALLLLIATDRLV